MPTITAVVAQYERAQAAILKRLLSKYAVYDRAMLTAINNTLAQLSGRTVRDVEALIGSEYMTALDAADKTVAAQYAAKGQAMPTIPPQFTVIHRTAIDVLVQNATNDLTSAISFVGRKIQDNIRSASIQAIADKVSTGTTIQKTRKILQELYAKQGLAAIEYTRNGKPVYMSLSAYAETVARSTTAEATNQATLNETRAVGSDLVKMTEHNTTCPICLPLQGRVYSISGQSDVYPKLEIAYSGDHASIHPNCVVEGTLVSGPPLLSHVARSYQGEVIIIHIASGEELTVTPNHPILTSKGWVAAGLIKKQDKVVQYCGGQWMGKTGNPDYINVPIAIEDISSAFFKSSPMFSSAMPVTSENFHGDGADSKVCIINTNVKLWDEINAIVIKPTCKKVLCFTSMFGMLSKTQRMMLFLLLRMFCSTNRIVSSLGQLFALICRHTCKAGFHCFASILSSWISGLAKTKTNSHISDIEMLCNRFFSHPGFVHADDLFDIESLAVAARCSVYHRSNVTKPNSRFFQSLFKGRGRDIKCISNLLGVHSREIKFADVIDVDRQQFFGHVYNLQTINNWYIANTIITHNCRHRLVPYIEELKTDDQLDAIREKSQRSFDIGNWDPEERKRAQASLDAYNKGQATKRQIWQDRRQFDAYKQRLGDDAPKSFSAFRRMKNANGESWAAVQSKYRSAGVNA